MDSPMVFDPSVMAGKLAALATRNVFLGTSSWKYEGWLGQLYTAENYHFRGKLARSRFEANCLSEYSQVFRTVCVDAGFYRFPSTRYVDGLAAQVPDRFRLSFKVTDEITLKTFPRLPRHGERAGQANPGFLNAELFLNAFLDPLRPYRQKIGLLIFEFGHFYPRDFARGRDFVAQLDQFLAQLPSGWQYGVEIRNQNLLQPDYFEVLREHGVAHVFNSWTHMPGVTEQMGLPGSFTTDFFAARFLLKPGRKYAEAVAAFQPYNQLGQEFPAGREALTQLISRPTPARPSFLFVNNRLEGSALATIAAVLGG